MVPGEAKHALRHDTRVWWRLRATSTATATGVTGTGTGAILAVHVHVSAAQFAVRVQGNKSDRLVLILLVRCLRGDSCVLRLREQRGLPRSTCLPRGSMVHGRQVLWRCRRAAMR